MSYRKDLADTFICRHNSVKSPLVGQSNLGICFGCGRMNHFVRPRLRRTDDSLIAHPASCDLCGLAWVEYYQLTDYYRGAYRAVLVGIDVV